MIIGHLDLPTERIAAICQKYRVKELSVFGSALRDDFRADSDIDLLVDLLPAHGLGLIDYLGCQEKLGKALGRRVDLVQKSGLKRFVRDEILQTQRIIYAS
jgi:predicted nucleotidyltransferase